jgi:3-phosphoshikimate 1-carboxyvinyltransferase
VSSQFVTALLLVAPRLEEDLDLRLEGELVSKPYVDLTVEMLENHGVTVDEHEDGYRVEETPLDRAHVDVPGDYSAAAFGLVAGSIAGEVTVTNLPEATGQGDEAIVELLDAFDVPVTRDNDALTTKQTTPSAAEIDLADNPDLFPPLAVLAVRAEGTTRLTGAEHLRDKESDRIAAMVDGLNELGVDAEPLEGGAKIEGARIQGGTVDARGDHRIQMAFATAALAAEDPVTITGPTDAHAVSYPDFVEAWRSIGARVDIQEEVA